MTIKPTLTTYLVCTCAVAFTLIWFLDLPFSRGQEALQSSASGPIVNANDVPGYETEGVDSPLLDPGGDAVSRIPPPISVAERKSLNDGDVDRAFYATTRELSRYLSETKADDLDLEFLVNSIDRSIESFELVASAYLLSTDAREQSVLLDAINDSNSALKIDLALELMHSSETQKRSAAYSWLNQNVYQTNSDVAQQALLDATYHESNNELLFQLISYLPLERFDYVTGVREQAVLRLNELAFHPDSEVSSGAVTKLAQSEKTQQTLNIVRLHLQDKSELRQSAALESLGHFEVVSRELMMSLDGMLNNADLSRENRAKAARILIRFENQRRPQTDI